MSFDEDNTAELPLGCFAVVMASLLIVIIVCGVWLYFEVSFRWNL